GVAPQIPRARDAEIETRARYSSQQWSHAAALTGTTTEDAVSLLEHPVRPLERSDWQPSELRRVVIRLADGALVQVGTARNRESAMTWARSVIEEIRPPTGEWPLINDRLLQPDAVVSVDVIRI